MLCRLAVFQAIFIDFFSLLSFFGGDLLTQHKSPTPGGLGFIILNVHPNGEGGNPYSLFLLLHNTKLKLSAYSYDTYLVRYEFPKVFDVFCHAPVTPDCGR